MWIVGRWLIRIALRLISSGLDHQHLEATLIRYITSIVSVLLELLLIVAILGSSGSRQRLSLRYWQRPVLRSVWPGAACYRT